MRLLQNVSHIAAVKCADTGMKTWKARLILLVMVLGGVLTIGQSPLRPKPFSDGYFHEEAKGLRRALLNKNLQSATPLVHAPGVPFYYLPAYLIIPAKASERTHWLAGIVWNSFVLWVAILVLSDAAERLGGEKAGLAAGILAPLSFFPLYYSAGIASETAAFAGAAAVVRSGVKIMSGREVARAWDLAALGIALAWLIAMRGNYVLTAPLVVLAGIISRRQGVMLGVCAAALAGVGMAWAAFLGADRLNRAMGAAPRQDAFLTHVVIQGAFQYRSEPFDWRPWEQETRAGSVDYAAYARVRRELAARQAWSGRPMPEVEWEWLKDSFRNDYAAWVRMAVFKAASALWFRISPMRIEQVFGHGARVGLFAFTISAILNAPFLAALCLAIWGGGRSTKLSLPVRWVCWAPFVGGIAFLAATYSEPRYLVPGFAGVLVLAAVAMAEWPVRMIPPGWTIRAERFRVDAPFSGEGSGGVQ